jgi:drug/metabolite transporter (DMT)-like permease
MALSSFVQLDSLKGPSILNHQSPIINPAPIVLSMSHPDLRPYFWMLCGSFSFTLMGVLAHTLLHVNKACDWQTVAVFRAGLVALFAALVARIAGAKLVFWPWRLWVRSIAGSGSMVCTFFAYDRLPLADVITLANTFPLWVAILSWPLYRHAPGVKMGLAILIGVAGVVLVEQPHFESGNLGVVAALAAAALTAVAMLGLHSLSNIDPRAVVVHFSSVATVVCLIAFFIGPREHDIANVLDPFILLKLAGMGVAALVGQLFLTMAFATGAPAKVSVVGLTQIVFALIFDVCLFDHQVNEWTLPGTVLIIAPTAWLLTRSRLPESGIGISTSDSRHPSPD